MSDQAKRKRATRKRQRTRGRRGVVAMQPPATSAPTESATRGARPKPEKPEWPDWVNSVKHPRARAFLVRYAECGNVSQAARDVGIGRVTHYDWLQNLPGYREAFEHAEQEAADRLEQEARRRAVEGWEEPVYQRGQLVGVVRRYSDQLLMFLMKGVRPEKYRERVDIGSEPGRPLAVQVSDADAEAAARLVTEFARQQERQGAVSADRADAAPDA